MDIRGEMLDLRKKSEKLTIDNPASGQLTKGDLI
jgi:hypothetical protein